ncbi:3-hydroxybenzoate 6-monooxygenase [Pseudolabrys taiwanensis]|uniref:3-hydroxybenzoate 6-monooxygenase n=1 Tax=Pseudolabrys taiwanensis TaxID=331696 RepID=A0A345ZTR9_9HYPH|nr:3-hydroxybenzoate 6-monooxygenase [Pseudolabrys taiwanensis]AXK80316.1 3-hydroxybenzoate 6-monooxygenase [Pseudolabrys taiwanensis]
MPHRQGAKSSVVVAGGGIGGLAAALGLARKGCRVTVLEQAEKFGEIGAGIQIGPNAFHAMDYLGIGDVGRARAVYVDALIMMDGMTGEQVFYGPLGDAFRKYCGNPYAVIHRADLHGAFLDACRAHELITLVNKERVIACENTASGAKVVTAAGNTYEADAVIGADGVRSKVREHVTAGANDPLRVSGHVAYRAVLPIEQMPEDLRWNAATLWAGPKCHMVHYPLQGWRSFNLVATFVTDQANVGSNEPGTREEVLSRFAHIVPKARKLLEVPTEWRRWVLGDRDPIPNWVDGRIALLGDAAHPTYQYFAQGACMAMEDAVCLADKVEKTGGDVAAAFQAYQEERIPRAYRVVLSSRELGRIYHADGVERLVRNAWLKTKTPEQFYSSVAWIYGGNGLTGAGQQRAAA